MKAKDLMSKDVACCSPDTTLNQVARMMVEHDCGEIPVVNAFGRLLGVVTDRDICCRAVAHDAMPHETRARDVMSTPVVSATMETDAEECLRLMEDNMIRRLPIVDAEDSCCGIISMADFACEGFGDITELVAMISERTRNPSNVHL